MSLDPLGDLLLLRDFKLDELLSLLNIASELFSLLIIIAPEEADFSLLINSLLFAGLADFLLLLFDLPERSKCSDLDLGMAELIQSANRSSSSCPVLSRLSIERSEREELKDMPKICPRYAQDMPKHTQDIFKITQKSAQDMPTICPRYA